MAPDSASNNVDEELSAFLANAKKNYPDLHPNFLTQICFELPDDFDACLPEFDLRMNKIVVRRITAGWLKKNVRKECNDSLETDRYYGSEVEDYLSSKSPDPEFVQEMLAAKTWPFLPVIVDHEHAVQDLGGESISGRPYHLIEGCHRVSYLLRMLKLGLVAPDSEHEILEVF